MKTRTTHSPEAPFVRLSRLFSWNLALENDYLRQENRILRSKLGKRVALTDSEI